VQIDQINSPFCAFSTLTTSLNYSKVNRGRKAASSEFDGCKRGVVKAEISPLAAAVKMANAFANRGRV
jgi:hypothetical protein